jgi:hypothetical protein
LPDCRASGVTLIRRTLGRDREHAARLLNRVGYEAMTRRIERGGV